MAFRDEGKSEVVEKLKESKSNNGESLTRSDKLRAN